MSIPTAAGFDQWYTEMGESPRRDEIVHRTLGLPPELESSSLLPWSGIAEIVDALGLGAGELLADLACGRGGYGMEVARRTGARLIGVDFSTVAVAQARARVGSFGLDGRAEFVVGDLVGNGLASAIADAALCVDAVQFANTAVDAVREARRILKPGGRLAFTCWEPVDPADERIPDRLREVNLGRDLAAGGFTDAEVIDKPQWRDAERALWEAAVSVEPGDDAALQSLHDEAVRIGPIFDGMRRVLATATA